MKTFTAFALLMASALLAAPTTLAQANGMGISATAATLDTPVPYAGSSVVNVTVTAGCLDAAQEDAVTIQAVEPPAWLTVTGSGSATPSQACLNAAGSRTVVIPVTIAVAKEAPGAEVQTVNFTAKMGTKVSAPATLTFSVAYKPDYTITTDAKFPLNVTGGKVSFNVTVTQKSNARSMVMMENISASAGSLSGLASVVYESDALVKVFNVTYKAPTGAWTNASASFTAYTHHLPKQGSAGDFMLPMTLNWTFVNAGSSGQQDDGPADPKSKGLPAPPLPLVAMGLLALVALARRR